MLGGAVSLFCTLHQRFILLGGYGKGRGRRLGYGKAGAQHAIICGIGLNAAPHAASAQRAVGYVVHVPELGGPAFPAARDLSVEAQAHGDRRADEYCCHACIMQARIEPTGALREQSAALVQGDGQTGAFEEFGYER